MPRDQQSLEQFDQAVKHDAKNGKQEDRCKSKRSIKLLVGNNDEIAKALVAADELANDGADDRKCHSDLHAAEQLRKRSGDTKFPERLPTARQKRLAEVQQF